MEGKKSMQKSEEKPNLEDPCVNGRDVDKIMFWRKELSRYVN
jgi:hypothetical protein